MEETMCHCGRPLHYNSQEDRQYVESEIAIKGEWFAAKDYKGHWWKVPRHYLALHGIKGHLLPSYGFERLPDDYDEEDARYVEIIPGVKIRVDTANKRKTS